MAFSSRSFDYSSDRLIPCVVLDGPPTEKTEGAIGVLCIDRESGNLYKCVSANYGDSVFTWKIVGEVSDDQIRQTVSDFLTQNPVNGGLSDAEKDMLLTLLRGAVYQDQYASSTMDAYRRLSCLWGVENGNTSHTHSYTGEIATMVTCTTAGVKTFTCACGDSYTEEIPATGHAYVSGICSMCGAIDSDYDASSEVSTLTLTRNGTNPGASVWYNEDGTEYSLTKNGYFYKADAVVDTDCEVTIKFSAESTNANIVYYVGQIKREDRLAVYFAEQLGTASTEEQVKTYTLHEGYELVIAVNNQSAVSTEVTCADGSFTDVTEFYTNLVGGYTLNAYLKSSDGSITPNWTQQNTSDLIDVSAVASVYILNIASDQYTMQQYNLTYCFYDESEKFISGGNAPTSTDEITPVAVPDGAKYMRVGGSRGNTSIGVYVGTNPAPYRYEFVAFA